MKISALKAYTLAGVSRTVRQLCSDAGASLSVVGLYAVQVQAARDSGGNLGSPFQVNVGADADSGSPNFVNAYVSSADLDDVHIYGAVAVVVFVYANDSGGPLPNWA